MRDELLDEALFFGLEHACHAIAEWTGTITRSAPFKSQSNCLCHAPRVDTSQTLERTRRSGCAASKSSPTKPIISADEVRTRREDIVVVRGEIVRNPASFDEQLS
jgi:hypothetical protein